MIRIFGRVFGSQSEKYDANGSESMSAKVSGAVDTPSVGAVFGPFESSEIVERRWSPHYPVSLQWAGCRYESVKLSLAVKDLGDVLG